MDDLVIVDGTHRLRIKDDGESQRLKTANASRLVPFPPALIEPGLLDHAATARKQGRRLFPDIRYIGNSLGAEPSKWFTKYRRSVGILDTDEAGRQKVSTRSGRCSWPGSGKQRWMSA